MKQRAKSFIAVYKAADGGTMLGGVKSSRSSRWGSRADAARYLAAAIANNASAGRRVVGRILTSTRPPEIFAHCAGYPSQVVGFKCFGCGTKLTAADAREYASRPAARRR